MPQAGVKRRRKPFRKGVFPQKRSAPSRKKYSPRRRRKRTPAKPIRPMSLFPKTPTVKFRECSVIDVSKAHNVTGGEIVYHDPFDTCRPTWFEHIDAANHTNYKGRYWSFLMNSAFPLSLQDSNFLMLNTPGELPYRAFLPDNKPQYWSMYSSRYEKYQVLENKVYISFEALGGKALIVYAKFSTDPVWRGVKETQDRKEFDDYMCHAQGVKKLLVKPYHNVQHVPGFIKGYLPDGTFEMEPASKILTEDPRARRRYGFSMTYTPGRFFGKGRYVAGDLLAQPQQYSDVPPTTNLVSQEEQLKLMDPKEKCYLNIVVVPQDEAKNFNQTNIFDMKVVFDSKIKFSERKDVPASTYE